VLPRWKSIAQKLVCLEVEIAGPYAKESTVEVAEREELADITAGDRLASKEGAPGNGEAG